MSTMPPAEDVVEVRYRRGTRSYHKPGHCFPLHRPGSIISRHAAHHQGFRPCRRCKP